jgi:hypothetical protein
MAEPSLRSIKGLAFCAHHSILPAMLRLRVRSAAEEEWRQREIAINYRARFAYRIDMWDADTSQVLYDVLAVAACLRWPGAPITLRQGTQVIEDSRHCARKGRYHVQRLIEVYGRKGNLMKWKEQLNGDCPRRDSRLQDRCDLVCPDLPKVL